MLPTDADAREVARALDAEQVTAGYLDFQEHACVALPAEMAHIEQTAYSVAKVIHLLLKVHTDFITVQSDACPLPSVGRAMPSRRRVRCSTPSARSARRSQIGSRYLRRARTSRCSSPTD